MGMYNMTCSATNTPVHHGDDVVLFVVKTTDKYSESTSLGKRSLSMPFFGKYNGVGGLGIYGDSPVNHKGEELEDTEPYTNDSYKVVMHRSAYDTLVAHHNMDVGFLWDDKDGIEESIMSFSPMLKGAIIDSDADVTVYNIDFSHNKFKHMISVISESYIDYSKENNLEYSLFTWLNIVNSHRTPEDNKTIFDALFNCSREEFIEIAQPYIDKVNLIKNSDKANIDFECKPFGRQMEDFELFKKMSNVTQKIVKSYTSEAKGFEP